MDPALIKLKENSETWLKLMVRNSSCSSPLFNHEDISKSTVWVKHNFLKFISHLKWKTVKWYKNIYKMSPAHSPLCILKRRKSKSKGLFIWLRLQNVQQTLGGLCCSSSRAFPLLVTEAICNIWNRVYLYINISFHRRVQNVKNK